MAAGFPPRAASDPLSDTDRSEYDLRFEASPDPWKAISELEFGADRTLSGAVEAQVLFSMDSQRSDLEKKLLSALTHCGDRPAAIGAVCRLLACVGGDATAAALAPLLRNPKTTDPARLALQPIPGEAASQALRDALPGLDGDKLCGLIGSIAARRDSKAAPALEKIAADQKQPHAARSAAQRALEAIA